MGAKVQGGGDHQSRRQSEVSGVGVWRKERGILSLASNPQLEKYFELGMV